MQSATNPVPSLNTNSAFLVLYAYVANNYSSYSWLQDPTAGFANFIDCMEHDDAKQLPAVDTDKYIPLLTLAKEVMQLQQDTLACNFAMRELLAKVKKFEAIRLSGEVNEIEEYDNLNAEVEQFITTAINLHNAQDDSKGTVNLEQAQLILMYHRSEIVSRLSEDESDDVLNGGIFHQIFKLLNSGRTVDFDRSIIEAWDSRLRNIRYIAEQATYPQDLTGQVLFYLLEDKDRIAESIIEAHFSIISTVKCLNAPLDLNKFTSLFGLLNHINRLLSEDDRKGYHGDVEKLLDSYPKEITLEILSERCSKLQAYFIRLHAVAEENVQSQPDTHVPSLSEEKADTQVEVNLQKLFGLYAKMLDEAGDDVLLREAVDHVGSDHLVVTKPSYAILLEHAVDATSNLSFLEWIALGSDEARAYSLEDRMKFMETAASKINSISDFSDSSSITSILRWSLLKNQMRLFNDTLLLERLENALSDDVTSLNIFFLQPWYEQIQAIKETTKNKDDLFSMAVKRVCADAKDEFENMLIGKPNYSEDHFYNILHYVDGIVRPTSKTNIKFSLESLSKIPLPALSTDRKLIAGVYILVGIATLVAGFVLSPLTSFTAAILSIKVASICMALGAALIGITIWDLLQPTGLADSLGNFISQAKLQVKNNELANPALVASQLPSVDNVDEDKASVSPGR